jgi:PTH1 family peptidyl-tRNA hydrolase
MRVVFAIGNPGARYAPTRHNAGFRVVDLLAARRGAAFAKASRLRMEARIGDGGRLVKPLTYVNRSGDALEELLPELEGDLESLNGLKDLERVLEDRDYPRLRIGVGAAPGGGQDLREHVLGGFAPDEEATAGMAFARAAEAAAEFLDGVSIEALMPRYNGAATGPLPGATPSDRNARGSD